MRQLPRELAVAGFVLAGLVVPAAAQQGSLRVTGSAQTVYGDPERLAGEPRLEPDFAVNWLQPRRSGSFELELRGTRRGREAHLGRSYAAWRDLKLGNASWTFEAGDFYFTPSIGEYHFANLTAPAVTLAGASASMRTTRSTASLVAGRTTAWRNIFGSDPDSFAQTLAVGRATHRPFTGIEVSARASRVRTRDLKEFAYTIQASDQAGGGARVSIGPLVQLMADGSYVSYRRAGSEEQIQDVSGTAGVSVLHSRGWVQANLSRFSPGEFPVVNYPLTDRESSFVAGEYDVVKRLRVFGGWESFRGNLDPARAAFSPTRVTELSGTRGFGGIRIFVAGRSSLALRVEEGDRRTRRTGSGLFAESDTGVITGELQSRFGRVTSFLRYSRRENVESAIGGGYEQTDGTAQVFVNLSRDLQLFGAGSATRNVPGAGGGTTYYQLGGGGQFQIVNRMLWLRVEGMAARNQELATQNLVARESFNVGINGQVARNTMVGFNLFAERSPTLSADTSPWLVRSTLRVTRSFPTGLARVPGAATAGVEGRSRGTGTVVGSVFADWDADGEPDPDEGPLEGIPVLLGTTAATTSARGDFSFTNVPTGMQRVQVDQNALPVDFDPPAVASLDIELARGETRLIAFGLVPLGTVAGRVLRDANGNGAIDDTDEPMEGAVLVLDGGLRSEQVRKGRYRFDAVRSGTHVVDLLPESLPEGATILSERRLNVALTRLQQARVADFLVRVDKRPEIRKVFPPKGGGQPGATPSRAPVAARTRPATKTPRPTTTRRMEPDSTCLYRIRVGRYASRTDASCPAAREIGGEKLCVIRER